MPNKLWRAPTIGKSALTVRSTTAGSWSIEQLVASLGTRERRARRGAQMLWDRFWAEAWEFSWEDTLPRNGGPVSLQGICGKHDHGSANPPSSISNDLLVFSPSSIWRHLYSNEPLVHSSSPSTLLPQQQ